MEYSFYPSRCKTTQNKIQHSRITLAQALDNAPIPCCIGGKQATLRVFFHEDDSIFQRILGKFYIRIQNQMIVIIVT